MWMPLSAQSGTEYFTGFLIEKSLSMDNVFVIALIFSFFAIPPAYQHRVLFWGIVSALYGGAIHPTAEGHAAMADAALPAARAVLGLEAPPAVTAAPPSPPSPSEGNYQ